MRPDAFRTPLTLTGPQLRLVPVELGHAGPLQPIWADPRVNRYMIGLLPGPERTDTRRLIGYLLAQQARGSDLAFTIVRASDGRPIGMTRFLYIDRPNEAVEVGGTWFDPAVWRTSFNTESKLLMLGHAFETEGVHRVCLQTDSRNLRSQTAIARIGARREAVLRENRRLADGGYRNSVYFRVLRREWPDVKRALEQKLDRSEPAPRSSRPPDPIPDASTPLPESFGPTEPLPDSAFRPPVTLRGRYVELAPLDVSHVPGLARAGRDPEVWRYLRLLPGRTESETQALVRDMLDRQAEGSVLPFAIIARSDSRPVGMFRFLDIGRPDRKVEIGTWLDSSFWHSPFNTEVKYLALRHAFETERVHRVQLRTDSRNARSQAAIVRLGAVHEGQHDEHLLLRDGVHRTSIVYSILESEWPTVKVSLEAKLARPWDPVPAGYVGPPATGTSRR